MAAMNEAGLIAMQELWRLAKSLLAGLITLLIVLFPTFFLLIYWMDWRHAGKNMAQGDMGAFGLALGIAAICSLISMIIMYKKAKPTYGD
ncbi:MAG: hypothetical protein ABI197_07505 [Granulicella sp.]